MSDNLRAELLRLISYALTCRLRNQPGWMQNFALFINDALKEAGHSDRFKFDGKDGFERIEDQSC